MIFLVQLLNDQPELCALGLYIVLYFRHTAKKIVNLMFNIH